MFKKIENEQLIKEIDLSIAGITFREKPLLIGGLSMEYYGIRKHGNDIDFIVAEEDYQALAAKYPKNQQDKWGDRFLSVASYEFLRSIFRFDYAFLATGAIEYEHCKVISLEKLFFMKVLAFDNQPEVEKHTKDYQLILAYFLERFQNKEFAATAEQFIPQYLASPDGIIYH
ncbi:hypothetical protein [Candidatus Enterococcus ferrettii]|uniref:Uncharacterized protein n=1 Tax=Candidatus Enterococcus ferrettii TaxID=2815324 RepID=A0ABV0EXG9_9ENTE|nr:hypothetical protein [Enterococcus sp. 665A]MBO1342218.1 hypothetical protein [Enterococcus sp. 665A]